VEFRRDVLALDETCFLEGSAIQKPHAPGDVTASVRAISNLGCAAADFAGFSVGSIALITRGTCTFADKIANAAAAGAVAALISNNSPGGAIEVTAVNPTLIPALFTTMGIGDEFRSLLTETGVIARVGVVPGPIAGVWRRHYNTIRPHASLGFKPPAPEVFVPAFAAWPAALRRAAPPVTLVKRPSLN
jgi:hypothetical protein